MGCQVGEHNRRLKGGEDAKRAALCEDQCRADQADDAKALCSAGVNPGKTEQHQNRRGCQHDIGDNVEGLLA
jgi:hypothetical protein